MENLNITKYLKNFKDSLLIISPTNLFFFLSTIYSLKKIFFFINSNYKHNKLINEAKEYRNIRDKNLDEFIEKHKHEISQTRINQIILLDSSNLLKQIHSQTISSYEATLAYCLRSAGLGKRYNWITEELFDEALLKAIKSDEKISKNIENILPLEGLPVSVKDCVSIKGKQTTLGLCSFINSKDSNGNLKNISKEDSLFTKIIQENGGIIFVKTNVPQNMLAIESTNNVWGATKNPWNKTKTCGGSTGGEAGLIAGYCSPFGIGTDIGGSLRIPAAYCGIYSLKPSSFRISRKGLISINGTSFTPNLSILSTAGPMARSAADILLFSKLMFGNFKEDLFCNNSVFDEKLYNLPDEKNRKIKIGIIKSMYCCNTPTDYENVLDKIKLDLKKKGFECEDFSINFNRVLDVAKNVLINTGSIDAILDSLGDEKCMKYYQTFLSITNVPNFMIKFISWINKIKGDYRHSKNVYNCLQLDKKEYLQKVLELQILKSEFIKEFKEKGYDAVISPVTPFPAPDIGTGEKAVGYLDFSYLCNVIDLPAAVVPIKLSEKDCYIPYKGDANGKFLKSCMVKDLPICVQVATLPNCDELCLRLMKEIDDIYRFDINFMQKVIEKLE